VRTASINIALMMEAVHNPETSDNLNVTTWRYIPRDSKLNKLVTFLHPLKTITIIPIKKLHIFQSSVSGLGNSSFAYFIWCCSWKNNTSSTSNNGPHRNSYFHWQ
jgi:hypothetical protein